MSGPIVYDSVDTAAKVNNIFYYDVPGVMGYCYAPAAACDGVVRGRGARMDV